MTAVVGGLLLLASAAPSVNGGALQASQSTAVNGMGGFDKAGGSARRLQSETCDEDVFVDSQITDLDYPVGGCYEAVNTTLNGFSLYSLGGAAAVGTAQIYVYDEGSWEIGVIEEVDETTGEATETSMVCTTEPIQASAVAADGGLTSLQLEDAWECTYFQNGVTNYQVPGDFTGVECGCGGRTTVEEAGDSGDGGLDTTAIAISALAALVVLAVVVCGCFIHLKQKKAQKSNMEAPKEDYAFST